MRSLFSMSILLFLFACDSQKSALTFDDLEVYAPLPGNSVTSGYAKIKNNGNEGITIESITSPDFKSVEIHETIISDGIARMIEIENLLIPQNDAVLLERGGKHFMFFEPTSSISIGQDIKLSIELSNGSNINIVVPAKSRF